MSSAIRSATAADSDAIATTLAKAFHDDPVKLHLAGGKGVGMWTMWRKPR